MPSEGKKKKKVNLPVSGLRGRPPVQESHLVSDRKDKESHTEAMIRIDTEELHSETSFGNEERTLFHRNMRRLFGHFTASPHHV